MTSQPDYLRYLESAQKAQTVERLLAEGFTVLEDFKSGESTFDLVASKGERRVAYEFKAGRSARTSRQNLARLQHAASQAGYEFHIVAVSPPPRVKVAIDSLGAELLSNLQDGALPGDLDSLSTHTSIESIDELQFTEVRLTREAVKVLGKGAVGVRLQFGSGADQRNDNGAIIYDSYPFDFAATLGLDGSLLSMDGFDVDTSSFYEEKG